MGFQHNFVTNKKLQPTFTVCLVTCIHCTINYTLNLKQQINMRLKQSKKLTLTTNMDFGSGSSSPL